MQVQASQIAFIVVGISCFFLLVAGLLVLYVYIYNKKKKQHLSEKVKMQERFATSLLQSQLETQEQTRQHLAAELHDNISAMASLIKINLSLLTNAASDHARAALLEESKELIRSMITDLKQLVIGLNGFNVKYQGLVSALQAEVRRIEKLHLFSIHFLCTGEEVVFKDDRQVILYRICQELLHNTVKHAQPQSVQLSMAFESDQLEIHLLDDGLGFNVPAALEMTGTSGLTNLYNRARLLGGSLHLYSQPSQGTHCHLRIPYAP